MNNRTTATEKSFNSTATVPVNRWDSLFEELDDLVNSSFRAWYCKCFVQLGEAEIRKLASIARVEGLNPRKYFSHLLKSRL